MNVVIVEDQPLFLDAIADALTSRSVQVTARATSMEDAIRAVDETAPHAALLDIRLPPTYTDEGLRVAEELRHRYPDVALLVLSSYAEVEYAERLLNLEEHSRSVGYLLKERVGTIAELVEAIHRVVAGEVVIDPSIIDRLMARRRRHDPIEALSPHERRILSLVAEGRSNLGIAQELGCQISTVEKHLSAITNKLGLLTIDGHDRRGVNVRVLATLEFLRSSGTLPPKTSPR
jgi:DNA-binding NarL/FixJ family response regulator